MNFLNRQLGLYICIWITFTVHVPHFINTKKTFYYIKIFLINQLHDSHTMESLWWFRVPAHLFLVFLVDLRLTTPAVPDFSFVVFVLDLLPLVTCSVEFSESDFDNELTSSSSGCKERFFFGRGAWKFITKLLCIKISCMFYDTFISKLS